MKHIDKLSEWLKDAVHGGTKSTPSLAVPHKNHRPPQALPSKKPQRSQPSPSTVHPGVMRVIPIGGLEEVGKNSMVVEYENDIIAIDMGFQFPEDEMFGVDYVIPDIQYLVERKNRLKGILITHGHLDHIGALPYVLAELGFPPVYGSKLSLGLIQKQLEEHKMLKQVTLRAVDNQQVYQFGAIKVEFFRVNHSIPDSLGLYLKTPGGSMVHTGDFKFDFTPADGIESDIGKMSEIGKRGLDLLFSDSTNANKPGHTISEKVVGENLEVAISKAEGRIVIACFASLIGRIQQIFDFAAHRGRKVFLSGASIEHNMAIAQQLGFLKAPKGLVQNIRSVSEFPDHQVLILTTGSQGEPMAALSRMATNAHAQVKIKKGDTVVVSSSPIIGNEKAVAFLVDALSRLGAYVVHNRIMDVHTSGHGQQEDLKMMMSLVRPKHFVPIHGNYYMRRAHGDLAPQVGIPTEHVHMMDNGNVIEVRGGKVTLKTEDLKVRYVVVDGLGRGDLGSQVLKDRERMAENGVVNIVLKLKGGHVLGTPVVSTYGFLYQKEIDKIVKEIEHYSKGAVFKLQKRKPRANPRDYEEFIRSEISGFIVRKLDRRPLIAPVVLFV